MSMTSVPRADAPERGVPERGVGTRRLVAQIAEVLDPLAANYQGSPPSVVRPVLSRVWRTWFGIWLREPMLSRLAEAISAGTPWQHALWSAD